MWREGLEIPLKIEELLAIDSFQERDRSIRRRLLLTASYQAIAFFYFTNYVFTMENCPVFTG